jgi:hypothetical protein
VGFDSHSSWADLEFLALIIFIHCADASPRAQGDGTLRVLNMLSSHDPIASSTEHNRSVQRVKGSSATELAHLL